MITQKRRRITQACDFCHDRGLKCKALPGGSPNVPPASCLTCLEHGQECARRRQPKKRGTKPRTGVTLPSLTKMGSGSQGSSSAMGDRRVITALLDVYLDSIHPTFPLFCEKELWVGWRDGTFPNDASDYMCLACMCALSAQHVGKRALFSDDIDASMSDSLRAAYITEAIRLVRTDLDSCDLNLVRSYGLLALLGAQQGNNPFLHKYLGLYHGASAQMNLHDEPRWPSEIDHCEKEVRRRLFWAMYRLEIHTACVLGNMVRCSETQSNVGYPVGQHHPAFIPGRNGDFEDWFSGWNITTDLYRVLEHVICDFRAKSRVSTPILGQPENVTSALVERKLALLKEQLLPQFGSAPTRSDDSGRNRCGFQASNILCTIHLARLISCISDDSSIDIASRTANDMVESMSTIPLEYMRAIGSPLVQQLAGVGHILLGVAAKQKVNSHQFQSARDVVSSIMLLLERLKEQNDTATTGLQRLADQLAEVAKSQEPTNMDEGRHEFAFEFPIEEFLLDNDGDHVGFPAQLLSNFAWPYINLDLADEGGQ